MRRLLNCLTHDSIGATQSLDYTLCNVRNTLKLCISLCSTFSFLFHVQDSAGLVILLGQATKEFRRRSFFGIKSPFWLPWTRLEMFQGLCKKKTPVSLTTNSKWCRPMVLFISFNHCLFRWKLTEHYISVTVITLKMWSSHSKSKHVSCWS